MNDTEYENRVNKLLETTVKELRSARGDEEKIRTAIENYLDAGDKLEMSPLQLRDYFDISTPGLAEKAGFSGKELEEASEIFTQVSNARYSS